MPKRDLLFSKPLMNAAGALGFWPDSRAAVPWEEFGAFVTNPLSLRPRKAAAAPAALDYPGGFLLHTGLPNPGLNAAVKYYARRWGEARLPIIVDLMADRPDQTKQMVATLEAMENIMAAELGFAPLLADDIILLAVEMCAGELPLIVSLPAERVLDLGPRAIDMGAAAINMAPPRGALSTNGAVVTGRLFGPSLLPRTLDAIAAAGRLNLPVIAAGGVYTDQDAQALLAAGAVAVQMDTAFWLPGG